MIKRYLSLILLMSALVTLAAGCAGGAAGPAAEDTASPGDEAGTGEKAADAAFSEGGDALALAAALGFDEADIFSERDFDFDISDEETVEITLLGDSAKCLSTGVSITGSDICITKAGTYLISGTLTDGSVSVEAPDDAKVRIALNGADISSSGSSAVSVKSADKVWIILSEGSGNSLTSYGEDDEIDAALYSETDLTITGTGSLVVTSALGHGVVAKDELTITGGVISVSAARHGLSAKDSLAADAATLIIDAGKDALHAEHSKEEKGFVYIASGDFTLSGADDGINASGDVVIVGGSIDITAGGVSASGGDIALVEDYESAPSPGGGESDSSGEFFKDLRRGILGHGPQVDSAGHFEGALEGGSSSEGIEASHIYILGGTLSVSATDDGLNAASDFTEPSVEIYGGDISISVSSGDGIDSNGDLLIAGGSTVIYGALSGVEVPIDYVGSGEITGGTLIAAGSAGQLQTLYSSAQGVICLKLSEAESGKVSLIDENETKLLSFTPEKSYSALILSSPDIAADGTYTVVTGEKETLVTLSGFAYSDMGSGAPQDGFNGGGPGGGMPGGGGRGERGEPGEGDFVPDAGEAPSGGAPQDGGFDGGAPGGAMPGGEGEPDGGFDGGAPGGAMPGGDFVPDAG